MPTNLYGPRDNYDESNSHVLFANPPVYFENKLKEMNYPISKIKIYLSQLNQD